MPKLKPSFDFAFLLLVSAISWPLLGGAAENQSVAAKSDPGWPRQVTRNDVRFVYYQPQVDEWKDYRSLRARFSLRADTQIWQACRRHRRITRQNDGKPAEPDSVNRPDRNHCGSISLFAGSGSG